MKKLLFLAIFTATSLFSASYERIEDKNTLKVLTPALAERKTAKIRLSNGLEAYLISDPGIHESAAALAVEAGSWQDPKEYPGMAHFLEHMLFMGTAAYPKENEYMQYINDNGGQPNAYTAPDRTVYTFSINNDAYKGALDRFSHFFVDPLFNPSSIGRELHAVDQEHAKNIENDNWRSYMILKETGNPDHPNAAFSTGNAATLSGIPQEALKKWYKEHYSSNRMHLVTISPLPLEEMIQLTVDKFSAIPNHHLAPVTYPDDMLSAKQKGHFIYIKPVKDLKSVCMLWHLPKKIALDMETDSPSLISYALANGTENGLLEQLKREKLAEDVAVSRDRFSKESLLFMIEISLTEAGAKQIDTIIQRTFQAINRLKETGIPRYIFDEKHKMAKIGYEYQSRCDAYSFVSNQVADMIYENLETFPLKSTQLTGYDPKLIRAMLDTLTPESCVFAVSVDPKLTGVLPTIQEKWMNAAYTIKDIPASHLTAWASAKPHANIDIPLANPFLPQSLALIPAPEALPNQPSLIASEEFGKMYFVQDQKYLVPETTALISLLTPQQDGSAKARAFFDLYARALSEKLNSPLFYANQAGLTVNFSQNKFNFGISVSGYSEKIQLFLKTIFQSLQDVSPTASEFDIYKQSLLSSYDNGSKELPVRQSVQLINSMIYTNTPTPHAKHQALKNISYEDFLRFTREIFKTTYIESLIYGNITSAEAANIWGDLKTTLSAAPFHPSKHHKLGVLSPADKLGPYMVLQTTERQGNSTVLMLHEGPFTMEKRAAQQLLSSVLKDDFFTTLRTKQQTGYIASAWDVEIDRQLLQFFAVQSNTHQPSELLARFELFMEDFSRHINKKIPEERFETLKASLIKELEMPPETIYGKASELYVLAFDYDADFEWLQKRIDSVKKLSYADFIATSKTFLSRSNLKRLAVLMEGVLPEENQFRYEPIQQDNIRNVGPYISYK
ncbi:MAG TPA: insulinase family protein [Rhabdochlamydiaceae bacterium]|nr:insulinase family protein [Rhabdochlamydiaceae bacterium]